MSKDFTLDDFYNLPLEDRLNIILKSIDNVLMTLSFILYDPNIKDKIVYEQIREKLDKYYTGKLARLKPSTNNPYREYFKRFENMHLLEKEHKEYYITTFGTNIKEFLKYSIKKYVELDIDSRSIFKDRKYLDGFIKATEKFYILKYIGENPQVDRYQIMKEFKLNEDSVYQVIEWLKYTGLINKSNYKIAILKIDHQAIENMSNILECRDKFKEYLHNKDLARSINFYLSKRKSIKSFLEDLDRYDMIRLKELWEKMKEHKIKMSYYKDIKLLLEVSNIIKLECFKGPLYIKTTEKFKRLYENIIIPIDRLINNKDELYKYYNFSLSDEDIKKAIKLYYSKSIRKMKQKSIY
ncbi:hypothetical protein MJ1_0363 [Nanobdella aerobiophila]|uniref:Uncharacterized protein n=1 Tax=Nanobdella aerobiophila TaxID=2586965 RepID=A0A915SIB3_9ARCH|nr:hypothetical protein [Nanobdella aerobiophila]BBL45527.1 hypothetical protein MJ1_0363 [Nanobdella aerobiophila]